MSDSRSESLDARLEAERLQKLYYDDARQQSVNILLLGEKGHGKTSLLRTARRPIHIDSFDPGGTIVLRDLIACGDVVPDTRYENENPLSPRQYSQWSFETNKRIENDYFSRFGTYCLDSATSWGDCILYWVQNTINASDRHAGETPRWQTDYRPVRTQMENWMRKLLALPCDFILTGHFTGEYQSLLKEERLIRYVFDSIGAAKTKIPTFFSEVWIIQATEKSGGNEYKVLTQHDGLYRASTRLGAGGKFNKWEEPNIKALLRKAGWPSGDKPKLILTEEEKESAAKRIEQRAKTAE